MNETANLEKRSTTAEGPEQTRSGRTYVPAVDIIEKDDELLLLADVPGAKAEGINIDYERGQLTIAAHVEPRQSPRNVYTLQEYGVGDFVRSFQIGESVDASNIRAEVSRGVLTLHLPKAEKAKTRKIAVKAT